MRFHVKALVAVTFGLVLSQTQADLVQSSFNTNDNEGSNLAARVVNRDNDSNRYVPSFNNFPNSEDRIRNQTLASKVTVPKDEPSMIDRLNTVASNTVRRFTQTGIASWYGRQFHGRKTANGETFDMNALTAAHRSLPLNCYIRVTNKDNGRSVVVKVNDRGPFHGNRVLDLSYGAAKRIGLTNEGTAKVSIERVDGPDS
ncbi:MULTISPECIES: septal ring lytic transglycosylase RlpA family protein [Acinetobacter]|jgi:rare lipoprotein A|uniref:Endolytic peptidoglycan transglycosylase RlpA n=1 Tax=Acinetobacter pollinis TaxID=2605270 RepID=A0ABU6DQY0_9GAMM|nr:MULTISPECIES: septal ring lytic transglycosylase RlpA family protein [Acinetobacter]MBF7691479.1 septal ring lytic transglycosylase RlpA family protein [Acinetobacter pollinis]MBF7693435.1 septal ring lytic transglycosylase RlpA family protein [Acinetobacter pollinis]MBF7699160.1 septal ring lytic transglycosylase RlpA family protein [Acinetobacter pollinis]MBF7700947.1 septal ring lytic transglycosylase RlpA family protein [Acinetobacter pollinis]MEB5476264.1 septal ring lytic transglycosy